MKTTLKKVAQILSPGTLQQKHEQISQFLVGGDSLLYSGQVAWKLTLPADDRTVKGNAENMDEAFSQIKQILEEMMKHTPPAAKVALAVKEKHPEESF